MSLTRDIISSVRNLFPKSEIILSTWQGSDTSSIDADIVLKNEDPGSLNYGEPPIVDNVNRQIVSTREGLRAASRPYAMKLRTDCRMTHSGVLDLFDRYPDRAEADRIFSDRIICCTHFSRDPRLAPFLFHPSDVFQFGRRADLLKAWDVPLRTLPEKTSDAPSKTFELRPYLASNFPLVPEQYLWTQVLAKAGLSFDLEHACDWSASWTKHSDRLFVANFVPYSAAELGIELPSHFYDAARKPTATYSHERWVDLHRQYFRRGRIATSVWRLLLSSGYVFFGFSTQPFWARMRIIAGALRRQIQHSLGLRTPEHS